MPIKINISLSSGGRFKPVASHTLHDKLITIGRDSECTLSLEDTQKHVSRMHAEITEEHDRYWLKVVSKVNPVAVNGKRHEYGARIPVSEDDQIHVGLYRLEIIEAQLTPPAKPQSVVQAVDESDVITLDPIPRAGNPAAPPPTNISSAAPPPATPLPEGGDEETTYVPPSIGAGNPPPPAAPIAAPPPSPLAANVPIDDEVTYIPPMWARLAAKQDGSPANAQDADDLTYVGRPAPPIKSNALHRTEPPALADSRPEPVAESALEIDFDLSEAFEAPKEEVQAPVVPPQAPLPEVEEGFSDDVTYVRRSPLKPPEIAPLQPAPVAKPPAPPAAEKSAKEKPQFHSPLAEIQARIAAKTPAAQFAPARPAETQVDRAVSAFLEGAGLAHLQISDPGTFLRNSGMLVRTAVGSILTLLADRAEARKALGIEASPEEADNPISSNSNPDEVITFLFDPKRPPIGDTDPAQAFSDACSDLRDHQTALLSVMRAAIMTTLLKLDPKRIEREHGSNLGVLNITRRSKLWDLSAAQHEQLAREIEENFAGVFSQELSATFAENAKKTRGS